MPPADLRRSGPLPVRTRNGAAVIELTGSVDAGAEGPLSEAWERAVALAPRAVAIDFEHADYVSSTGIALIVGLLAKARTWGLPLRAFGLDAHYREIFEVTRLADFVEIHDDEAGAVGPALDSSSAERSST